MGASSAPAEWNEIAFIEGAGTTDEPQRYEWVDARVPFAAERLRYRLRQVDLDAVSNCRYGNSAGQGPCLHPRKSDGHDVYSR